MQPSLFRTSASERPRTYDKYYQKTPSNFHVGSVPSKGNGSSSSGQTDSAISMCSSEDEAIRRGLHRPDQDQEQNKKVVKRRSKGKRKLEYSRTITERDVKHLERHLSMKKTIRKKIMRDLQQAFVDDPKDFKKKEDKLSMDVLNFDPKSSKNDQRFLDMLRDSSDDSGHGSPSNSHRHKFRSVRERPKPRYPLLNDTSSCEDEVILHKQYTPVPSAVLDHQAGVPSNEDEIVVAVQQIEIGGGGRPSSNEPDHQQQKQKTKRSFWQLITGKKKGGAKEK